MTEHRNLIDFEWCAGHLYLDFLNTANQRDPKASDGDYLTSYAQWVGWCLLGNLLSKDESDLLLEKAGQHPEPAKQALLRVIRLRSLGIRMTLALLQGKTLTPADRKAWREWIQNSLDVREFAMDLTKCRWTIGKTENLDDLLWLMVEQAENFFENPGNSRLKDCPLPEGCGWFFQDQSKNNSRRWCSMKTCGNSAKVRRFLRRRSSG